uniref:Uncharacterized protein n=1 Tax=Rhizophora mucronata TaxID=61149 RepID=A0A2P2ND25_RHIMU
MINGLMTACFILLHPVK